jgi:diguanylate cyclase (GGDEF)-like protein
MDRHERYLQAMVEHLDFAACILKNGTMVYSNNAYRHSFGDEEIAPLFPDPQTDVRAFAHKDTGLFYSIKRITLDEEFTVLFFAERKGVSLATDPLTGLLHRESFPLISQQVLDDARSRDRILALLFVDLDGFKIINDTWGHESGDVVLQKTAARMTHTVRNNDICFRMGGDEFVILLCTISDRMHSCLVSRRLISAISEPIPLPSGNQAKVGASIGIATFPTDGSEIEELLHKADEAMYLAKKLGKNNYQLHR